MDQKLESLNSDDVVCFTDEDDGYNTPIYNIKQRFSIGRLFEFSEFVEAISRMVGLSSESMEILTQGIPCRVMTTRQQGWRWGKIRLKIELQFIPDETIEDNIGKISDNPLDEIRRSSELD
ncbi:MAG: KGK domain-containing protein [Pseudanabaenaceae cyanobacterium bins.39]|nr:KGK domain-containing protein [Pseudanabaenaceae cyanobacterium bins.39]